MFREIAFSAALFALPCAAHTQELTFNIIQETFSLTKADILEAKQDFQDGRPMVRIKVGPAAAARFGDVTSRNINKVMQLVIGDRILTAAIIRSSITGGEFIIEGAFTVSEADELAKRIK